METGHPSTLAVNSGSGNRALEIETSRYTMSHCVLYGCDTVAMSLKPRLHQDTCSPDTSCIHLYLLSHPVSATKFSLTRNYVDMYPLVSGYKLLVRDTCIRLSVSAGIIHVIVSTTSPVSKFHAGSLVVVNQSVKPVRYAYDKNWL